MVATDCAQRGPDWVGWWVLPGGRVSRAVADLVSRGAGQPISRH